jgi:hypothetical protein
MDAADCSGEPKHQGASPCDQRVFKRIEKNGVGHGGPEKEGVIVKLERRNYRKFGGPPKADDHDQYDG